MSSDPSAETGPARGLRVDREGELWSSPSALRYVWAVLLLALGLEAVHELFAVGGPSALYEVWIHDGILAAAAILTLARAWYEPRTRSAWLAFGAAAASWCAGSVLWSILYGDSPAAPYPTSADVLWLLWYPLMALGIVRLIRFGVPHFELHRWMDGVAAILVVLSAGFAFVIAPVAGHARQGSLATVVDFSYPTLDILLIGALLGVYGLLAWRPDAMWILIGLGTLMTTIADAAFAVQEARGVGTGEAYAFVWTLGALSIAYAAWVPVPSGGTEQVAASGFRAIALILLAQALAAGIQVYAFFEPVDRSERVLTVAVLLVASVQIVLTRPGRRSAGPDARPAPGAGPPDPPTPRPP